MRTISVLFILVGFLSIYSCGTLFRGYNDDVTVNIPAGTRIFDENYFEIPLQFNSILDSTGNYWKTSNDRISLRTSHAHELYLINEVNAKKILIEPKIDKKILTFDLIAIPFYLIFPITIDYLNGNLFSFDTIKANLTDFDIRGFDTSQLIYFNQKEHLSKRIEDEKKFNDRGLLMEYSRASFYIGTGFSTLGNAFLILIPPHLRTGLTFRLLEDFYLSLPGEYSAFMEEYGADYTGTVVRYGIESRYYPLNDIGWFISAGISKYESWFEKYFSHPNPYNLITYGNQMGLSIGTGYGGKWWFVDATYSIGTEKIKVDDNIPFLLNYLVVAIFFNLPF